MKRYVAFIDILGFKGIVNSYKGKINDLGEKLSQIFNASIYSAITGEDTKVGIQPGELPNDILFYQFSDSVILYTKDDSDNARDKMVLTLNYLLARSALQGFPLRGGLVKEELYAKPPILVGEGIIKAYGLEMKQEWSGVIVHKDCYTLLDYETTDIANKLIARVKVPVKDDTNVPVKSDNIIQVKGEDGILTEEHLVINWPQFVGMRVNSREHFKECLTKETGIPSKKKDIAKIENTLNFFEQNIGYAQLPSLVFTGAILRGGRYILNSQKE
ncbi:TPA: hypothetical protein ACTZ5A_005380 [Bacillus cereus]